MDIVKGYASCEKQYNRLMDWVQEDCCNRYVEFIYTARDNGTVQICYVNAYVKDKKKELYFVYKVGTGNAMWDAIKELSKQIKLKKKNKD